MSRRRFGKPKALPAEETFDFFELEELRLLPFGEADLMDFFEVANGVDENSTAALPLIKTTLRAAIHPDDFERFWTVAKRERQGVAELLEIMYAVVEMTTGRPTSQPSGSTDGLPATATNSTDDLSSQVITRLVTGGRPDLALMVDDAHRAQTASA